MVFKKRGIIILIVLVLFISGLSLFSFSQDDLYETSDFDQDGIPDLWEKLHGLRFDKNDAHLDPDNDSLTNLEEYYRNSDPLTFDEAFISQKDDTLEGFLKFHTTKIILYTLIGLLILGIVGLIVFYYMKWKNNRTDYSKQIPSKITQRKSPYVFTKNFVIDKSNKFTSKPKIKLYKKRLETFSNSFAEDKKEGNKK